MGLLEKFESVEVKTEDRISLVDRLYCQKWERAYHQAKKTLMHLYQEEKALLQEQAEIDGNDGTRFLPSVRPSNHLDALRSSHEEFVKLLFSYFQRQYNVSIDALEAIGVLIPKPPKDFGWSYKQEEWDAYHKQLDEMELTYTDVLDQIFIQLGGYSFQDKAVQEIKDAAHDAGWSKYHGSRLYEQKKAVISFGYGCSFDSWYEQYKESKESHHIKFPDSIKSVVRAMIHFEYGLVNVDYSPLNFMLGYDWKTDEVEKEIGMEKIKSIKCFKNNRLDIRFTSEAYARQFAEDYLGTEVAA